MATSSKLRLLLVAVGYVAAFVALDWASYIRPFQGLNITPWNPQPALAVALLMYQRNRPWLVWLGLAAAEWLVRGLPANLPFALAASIALTLTYAAIARALTQRIGTVALFHAGRDLFWFTVIVALGSLLGAIVYVSSVSAAAPALLGGGLSILGGAITRYWVGDTVGLIVTLPVVLSLLDPGRRKQLALVLRSAEWWATTAASFAGLWLVFRGGEQDYFKYFYLLLLPVVWASARFGLPGAVLSSLFAQVGLIMAAQVALQHDLTLFELQVLMAVLTLTALLVGVLVDERAHTAAELRNSLRFAAAGQMSAALAHELNQPLTALANYAAACRTLAASGQLDADRRQLLERTLDALSGEAQRAGHVIRRLRDFFRAGASALVRVCPNATIEEAVQAQRDHAGRRGVTLQADIAAHLPPLWLDPIQIAVVARNLLANAIESAAGSVDAQVRIEARQSGRSLIVAVHDSGPGLNHQRAQTVFDVASSSKPEGLGVGLSICRAIVEAHGGKLWAEPGGAGHFLFSLPTDDHEPGAFEPAS